MKVHRIITTIEVENDNSITSVELTNLHLANNDIHLAITNLTSNGNAMMLIKCMPLLIIIDLILVIS